MALGPIDTHVHVFTRALPLAPARRYAPDYDAPVQGLLVEMDRANVAGAVLVQPSFLGTDNAYLLASLAAAPHRLRGIVVVDPDISDAELAAFERAGVVGARFNLIGRDPGMLERVERRALARRLAERGWQIELQAEGGDLPRVLDTLQPLGAPVVIDHFGRPDSALGMTDPGFRRLLAAGADGNIWVKLSGSYRCGGVDVQPYVRALIDALGPGRLIWGSDWPFTQFETTRRYADGVDELRRWCSTDVQGRIAETARRLFGFGSPRAPSP